MRLSLLPVEALLKPVWLDGLLSQPPQAALWTKEWYAQNIRFFHVQTKERP